MSDGFSLPPAYPPFSLQMEGDDEELEKLKRKIEEDRGFNCQFYKEKCLRRRIAVRMRARGQRTFQDYGALLDRDPAEYDHLLDTLTINVTKFFRNPETYDALARLVVPALWARPDPVLRVWSAGSASGEEAVRLWRKALELNPGNAVVRTNLELVQTVLR